MSERTLLVAPLLAFDVPRAGQRAAGADATVVVPNRQAARYRTLPTAPHANADRGGLADAPRADPAHRDLPSVTLADLARRVVERAGLRVASPLHARRTLTRAVAAVGEVADVAGYARRVEPTIRELLRAGVDFRELAEDRSDRLRRLGRVGIEYLRRLALDDARGPGEPPRGERASATEARGRWIDEAELFWRAAGVLDGASANRERVIVVGYPRLPGAERGFLHRVAAAGSIVALPCSDAALFGDAREAVEDFRRNGWTVAHREIRRDAVGAKLAAAWLHGRAPGAEGGKAGVRALAYPDLDAEVRGALSAVKRLLRDGVPPDRIALVARQETAYGPRVLSVAEEYGVPVRVLYATPIADTRFGQWVEAALDLGSDGYPFEDTARWLALPPAAALDADAWRIARVRRPSGRDAWRKLVPRVPADPWPQEATRGEYVEALASLADAFGVCRRAAMWPREVAAAESFFTAARALAQAEPDRRVGFEAWRAEVTEALSVAHVPQSPGRGGVELHTPLSLFGADVDQLFVLGAAEGALPEPVRPDPMLDPWERERLGQRFPHLEDVRSAARREEISFWAAVQSATDTLTVSYPKLAGRSELLPSPYLERLGVESEDAPALPVASRTEWLRVMVPGTHDTDFGDATVAHAARARDVELRRESEQPHDAHDGVTGTPYEPPSGGIGASRVIDMASCPFKFFAKVVLRLQEPDETPEGLDPRLLGTLFHDALHGAVERALGRDDLRAAALEHLDDALAGAERALLVKHGVRVEDLPQWPRAREEYLAILENAVRGEDFLQPGAEPFALERSFEGVWRGIPVRGRVDRVDRSGDRLILIDYKSGSSVSSRAKDVGGEAKVDLQLPIYREAAAERLAVEAEGAPRPTAPHRAVGEAAPAHGAGAGRPASPARAPDADAYYYSVTKAARIRVKDPAPEELERIAAGVLESWRAGAFPVDPDIRESACAYCEFDAVCRRGPRLERKRRGE